MVNGIFMEEQRKMRIIVAVGFFLLLGARNVVSGADLSEVELKQDALSRLVGAQDPSLSVRIGRVYVKQAALSAARLMLFEKGRAAGLREEQWNLNHPEWRAAEGKLVDGTESLIRREVDDPRWVRQAWSEIASTLLNGEEADEIAVHFESEGGQLQRRVIEWYVGELTLQTYTFTDRLKYGVPGSEQDMERLRETTYEIRSHFPPIYDLTKFPNAMRFASREPGVKYFKMMVMQGVHAVHVHLEKAANQVRQAVLSRSALVDPHIARVLAAGTGGSSAESVGDRNIQ